MAPARYLTKFSNHELLRKRIQGWQTQFQIKIMPSYKEGVYAICRDMVVYARS